MDDIQMRHCRHSLWRCEARHTMKMNQKKCLAAVQGFGNVGSIPAHHYSLQRIKVVGISDHTGVIYNTKSINIEKAIAFREKNNAMLKGFKNGEAITNDQ